jgi:hypothetical protein
MTNEALFTMKLTDEQILDAIRIHRDECAHCNSAIPFDFDQIPEEELEELVTRILREPCVRIMLAERYEPEKLATARNKMWVPGVPSEDG